MLDVATDQDVRIHITGDQPSKKKRASSKNEQKRPKSKKRRSADIPPKQTGPLLPATERTENVPVEPLATTSYRHLFSFADNVLAEEAQRQAHHTPSKEKQPFTFLGNSTVGQNDGHAHHPEHVLNNASSSVIQSMEIDAIDPDDMPVPENRPYVVTEPSHFSSLEPFLSHIASGDNGQSIIETEGQGSSTNFATSQDISTGLHSDMKPLYGPGSEHHGSKVPDYFNMPPDAILSVAQRFYRIETIEKLENEWCSPTGMREEMRRDFKQKRQSANRGRKLGNS